MTETNENIKTSETAEVAQLDDSCECKLKNIVPNSSSVKKDIVIRLKSEVKPFKRIAKNPKSDKNINKHSGDRQNEGTCEDSEMAQNAEKVLDSIWSADPREDTKYEILSVGATTHELPVHATSDRVRRDKTERKNDIVYPISSTEGVISLNSRPRCVNYEEADRCNSTVTVEKKCDKLVKASERTISSGLSSSDEPGDERSHFGRALCSSLVNTVLAETDGDKVSGNTCNTSNNKFKGERHELDACVSSTSTGNLSLETKIGHSEQKFSAGNVDTPLKRHIDDFESTNRLFKKIKKSVKTSKKSAKPTTIVECNQNSNESNVLTQEQSVCTVKPEDNCVLRVPAIENTDLDDISDTSLDSDDMLENETWTIVDSADSISEEMETEEYSHTKSSRKPRNKDRLPARHHKRLESEKLSDNSADAIVAVRKNRYHCRICNLYFPRKDYARKHAKTRRHIEKIGKRETKKRANSPLSEDAKRLETDSLLKSTRIRKDQRSTRNQHLAVLHSDGIEDLGNAFFCWVCHCSIPKNRKNLKQHQNGRLHNQAFQKYKDSLSSSSELGSLSENPDYLKKPKVYHHLEPPLEDEFGYCERIGKSGKLLYCCSLCKFSTKKPVYLRSHMDGRKHKEIVYNTENVCSYEEPCGSTDFAISDSSCDEEFYNHQMVQNTEDSLFDSDYQSDILWNQCYESFMRNIISRDEIDSPMNSNMLSPELQTFPIDDSSFQPGMERSEQGSCPIVHQLQIADLHHPQSEQSPLLYTQPINQILSPNVPSCQDTLLPYMPHQMSSEQPYQKNEVNDTCSMQSCVNNEDDAEFVIDIIHSLLHNYLKYRLKELPGSLLKILCNPSLFGRKHLMQAELWNNNAASRSVEQLLYDLGSNKSKFRQTFVPVTDSAKASSNDMSYVDEKK